MGSTFNVPPVDLYQLQNTPLFKGLAEADLLVLLKQSHPHQVQSGGFFFFQNDPTDRVYMLIQGRVKLTQSGLEGEQDVLMQVIGPYHLFGAVALTQIPGYLVSAQAAEDSAAIYWERAEMMPIVSTNPILAINAIQMMAVHTQEFQERFRQMATQRVERRLANMLLKLASQTGIKTPEGILINMPLTRQDLAEMTGTTLFTVSRLLKQWDDQGLVISKREQVTIRYPHGLVMIAEDLGA
jgi:CRP-like cAMP-binding protein